MKFDDLQQAWNSPTNQLSTGQQQQLARQLIRQLNGRRRFQALWLTWTFAALTVVTFLAVRAIATGKANLEEQWGLFPLLTVPWGFALHFLLRFLMPEVPPVHGELTITESLRAALAQNRSERARLKLVGVLFAVMIPALGLGVWQLHATGKASGNELWSMAVFFGVVLALSGSGVALRYFKRLLPQQQRLDSLLAELEDAAAR